MSAWIVSEEHVNALCDLAARGPSDCEGEWEYGSSLSYYHGGEHHEAGRGRDRLSELGVMLWAENYASVNFRYGESDEPGEFRYVTPARRPTVIEGLKIVSCFEYQSCEHDGWKTSAAKAFCTALHHALVSCSPGYEAAPWGWTHA